MKTVLGLDPSLTGTAVCIICEDGSIATSTIGSSPADTLRSRFLRYGGLLDEVIKLIPNPRPEVVCIEGYSFASKGGKAFDRVEYGALLRRNMLWLPFSQVFEIPPSSLKLFATGKGNADKTAVALGVFKRWGREFPDDNQTDAYVLARLAACIAGFDKPQTDAQKRAIDSVLNGKPKKPKPNPA